MQPEASRAAARDTQGCSLSHIGLQPEPSLVSTWQAATYSAVYLLHLGLLLVLPFVMELWLELDLRQALSSLARDWIALSPIFHLFSMQTKATLTLTLTLTLTPTPTLALTLTRSNVKQLLRGARLAGVKGLDPASE